MTTTIVGLNAEKACIFQRNQMFLKNLTISILIFCVRSILSIDPLPHFGHPSLGPSHKQHWSASLGLYILFIIRREGKASLAGVTWTETMLEMMRRPPLTGTVYINGQVGYALKERYVDFTKPCQNYTKCDHEKNSYSRCQLF